MSDPIDWFKLGTGESVEDIKRTLPTHKSVIKEVIASLRSNYEQRLLGYSDEGEQTISEEERYLNFHILGAPGTGKSKFLEYHIRKDIDMGNGLCLFDPSARGDTARNILNYCASIDYKKVILIDPTFIDKYKRIPCLAPLSRKNVKLSVEGVMESLNILFDAKSTATPRIRHYLKALLRILAMSDLTLADTKYFTKYEKYKNHREAIYALEKADPDDVETIREIFATPHLFREYFSSSIHRIGDVLQEPLASIFDNTEGINFRDIIVDGWVVLVNLSLHRLNRDESRLLGIIILSQIINTIDALVNNDWKGVFYLYLDEAGFLATPQISETLLIKRKSGLRMYLAHQDYLQFKGKEEIASAIDGAARVKLMFNVANPDDRMRMIKNLGYGGSISPSMATYANSDIPKQNAVLKKNLESPVRIRIPDVEPVPEAPREYIEGILSQSFYKNVDEFRARQRTIQNDTRSDAPRKVDDDNPSRPPFIPRGIAKKLQNSPQQGEQKPANPPERKPRKI